MVLTLDPARIEPLLDWHELIEALKAGHTGIPAPIGDVFLHHNAGTMLTRVAWAKGLGRLAKIANVTPSDSGRQRSINGAVLLFDATEGTPQALLDFHLVTKWKTAADSLLAASLLARPDSERILIVGAGTVARSLIEAYAAVFPNASLTLWNRTPANAGALADAMAHVAPLTIATDLEAAVRTADIISTATLSTTPIIDGAWLAPGAHLDLIGAFHAGMRETDDVAMQRSSVFVDSRATTLEHIGELIDPLANGTLKPSSIRADFHDIPTGRFTRRHASEITLFKNGGGAHLDLITAHYILNTWHAHHRSRPPDPRSQTSDQRTG